MFNIFYIVECFCFGKREYVEGEIVFDYVVVMRKLLDYCLFDEVILDDMFRDRLVCGLCNEYI